MQKRVAYSYIRMSNPSQIEGNSLERQLSITRSYSKRMGFSLNEDYRDIGLSAFTGKHIETGQLGKFIEAVESGKIEKGSVLIIENLDRFSRQPPLTAMNQLQSLVQHGIDVHELHSGQIYTKNTLNELPMLLVSLIGFNHSNQESEKKRLRLKNAWQSARDKLDTKVMTARCPAWLVMKTDRTGYDLKSEEAKIIKKIFDLCINDNMGAFAIARYLNARPKQFPKITAAQKHNRTDAGDKTGWQKSYIIKILKNPAVHGRFQARTKVDGKMIETGPIYENFYPSVISKERFHSAQAKKSVRKIVGGGRKGEKFANIFTKLIFCGTCGGSVHYRDRGESRHGGIKLVCSNNEAKNKCNAKAWDYQEFVEAFFNFVNEVDLKDIIAGKNTKDKISELTNEKKSILSIIDQKRTDTKMLFDKLLAAEPAAQPLYTDQINKIGNEIVLLEERLQDLLNSIADYQITFNQSNIDELKDLILEIDQDADNDNLPELRRALNARIVDIIEKIILNTPTSVAPFETNLIKKRTRQLLKQQGYNTAEDVSNLLETNVGKKLIFDLEKTFTVFFKNKIEKIINPSQKRSVIIDNRKLAALANTARLNNSKKEIEIAKKNRDVGKISKGKNVKNKN